LGGRTWHRNERSLREELEETLALQRRGIRGSLKTTLASTLPNQEATILITA
jgi:hypothetical protein